MTFKTLTTLSLCVFAVSGCATSLQSLPAAQIAGQAVREPDVFTGLTQTQMPVVAPFERSGTTQGTARLLSAEAFEGQPGGAWMDVSLYYDTPGEGQDQMRVYKSLNWAGGETAKLADFAASLASCEDRVTQYNRGGYYGRSGFGYGGYGGYGFGNRVNTRHLNKPRSKHGTDQRVPRPDRPSTSRPSTNRPSTNTPVSRRPSVTPPKSRPAPQTARRPSTGRPQRTRREATEHMNSHFQNSDLAQNAAARSGGALPASRLRLSPVSPFRRGYNYGAFGAGAYGYPASDYVISSACGRVEKLRIFVPPAKLESAERYGLTLYARSESGDARTIVLPPNYVLAYQMAVGGAAPAG